MKLFTILFIFLAIFSIDAFAQNTKTQSEKLSNRQQSIVAISALTAIGNVANLKQTFTDGLTSGLTVNEIKEELIHLAAYCGFPRSLNGIITFNAVVDERKAKGIIDVAGKSAMKVADTKKYEQGKKVLESLTGRPETGPKTGYAAFVPAIDTLLKEHLFNDIFTRGVLTNEERELITISALSGMGGADAQLQSHLGICMHLGFSQSQLGEVLSIIESKIGKVQADTARAVLSKVTAGQK